MNRIEFIIKGVSVTPRSVVLNRIEFIIKGVSVTHRGLWSRTGLSSIIKGVSVTRRSCGLEQD